MNTLYKGYIQNTELVMQQEHRIIILKDNVTTLRCVQCVEARVSMFIYLTYRKNVFNEKEK